MIQQVRELLASRNVRRAVIIDDAFDDRPKSGDIESAQWDRFFDDLTEPDEQRLAAAYGQEAYDRQDDSALRRDALFVETVWAERANVAAAATLFGDFEQRQDAKRAELEPLRRLLQQDLGLTCDVFGRDEGAPVGDADVVFLDLYLGLLETEDAVNRAIGRVKGIVDQRRAEPPNVVLLSASPRLMEVGPRLRDEAELLGCQFRMVRKNELGNAERMAERLYDLVVTYPDALKVNGFLLAWDAALNVAKAKFLRSIRTLDLADYANLQALVLEAEKEPVGDYVLDLYDLHLHNVLEGEEHLIRSAKALNEINWDDYPPAQFMPSPELIEMMDGALFQNETRTRVEAEITNDERKIRLGDVFVGPVPAAATGPVVPAPHAPPAQPEALGGHATPAAAPDAPPIAAAALPVLPAPGPAAPAPLATPPPAQPAAAAEPEAQGGAPAPAVAAAAAAIAGEAAPLPTPTPAAPRRAFVVLSQACDLQHANAEQALLMRGTLHPYTSKQHHLNRQRTPVMRVGEFKFSVDWDVVAPETWPIDAIPAKVAQGFRRVRRFRMPFALQLQQDFIGNLGRVGTLTAVPANIAAGVRIYLRIQNGNMRLLVEKTVDSGEAAYLVGRNARGEAVEKLLLSPTFRDEFRGLLRDVAAADLPMGGPRAMANIRDDPAFYRRFKSGLTLRRDKPKGTKPFANTSDDVVQIVAARVCTPDAAAPPGFNSIIVEVDLD